MTLTHRLPRNPLGKVARNDDVVRALAGIGRWLGAVGYAFVPPTPATHALVNSRMREHATSSLRDIFGWSRPFMAHAVPTEVLETLQSIGMLECLPQGWFVSKVRYATVHGRLYAHSAYPTHQPDAVFLGPDTYRFAHFIRAELATLPLRGGSRVVDLGCGAGPGGMLAAAGVAKAELVLADINPLALTMARANAALADVTAVFVETDLLAQLEGDFDCIVANPPYLHDAAARTYRHGGGHLGTGLSVRIVAESLDRLADGGRLLLYTGAAIVDGEDAFLGAIRDTLQGTGCQWTYHELDPDVFGDELSMPAYQDVERIAAVGLKVQRPGAGARTTPAAGSLPTN